MDGIIDPHGMKPFEARTGKHVVNPRQAAELAATDIIHGVENARRRNDAAIAGRGGVLWVRPEWIIITHTMGKMTNCILAGQ